MKVPKEARALLRKRKLARFRWPLETEPREQGVYALQGQGSGPADERFKVIAVAREEDGFSVAALIVDDPLRLLPKAAGPYETEPSGRVMRDGSVPEPEAVDEDTQNRFSASALKSRQDYFADLADAMDEVRAALDQKVREKPDLERHVGRELMRIRNHLRTAREKLGKRKAA
jgi:hypothetical protein